MPGKINIALLWHMHQPLYKNPYTQKTELPWVRLHGLKDYYGMVALLNDFPRIKATYNLVPSLLSQLEGYCRGERDIFQDIFIKDAQSLEIEEIHFLVRHFFSANHRNLIRPWPRYRYLHEKKNKYQNTGFTPWEKIFKPNELRDLQVWFQLCHFDEIYKKENKPLKELIKKGENFTEEDKKQVEEVEKELLAKIIPGYKKFADSGQIELCTSPYFHPILPLLVNPQEGRITNPGLPEYDLHFNWTEDAVFQLESALDYMEKTFGKRPMGIWPSEGSLSMEVLKILDDTDIQWTATDELNLSRSLGIPIDRDQQFILKDPGVLYKPYAVKDSGIKIKIFFRDRYLSDLIGFHYQETPHEKAAADLVDRIKRSGMKVPGDQDIVVPIILDGENAWEFYPNNGRDFLKEFFRLITEDEDLETVNFSEALDMGIEPGVISQLSSGSWVNGNFDIWIGDEEDRKAWKLLEKTKRAIEKEEHQTGLSEDQKKEIRGYISIAQGSDWFWWFGKENYTPDLHIFDNLFRKNLQKVYELLGKDIPAAFSTPIANHLRASGISIIPPSQRIHPRIDGRAGSYYEWLYAGHIDVRAISGALHVANLLVNTLYYGFDKRYFYLRVDTREEAVSYFEEGYTLDIIILKDGVQKRLPIIHSTAAYDPGLLNIETAIDGIIEVSIPLKVLNLREGRCFYLQLEWRYKGDHFQAIPSHDYFRLTVPKDKDYAHFWTV
jgi:alpha-amylase/alpha-mannosidase (GH57 family)